jgi:hypothetical protein
VKSKRQALVSSMLPEEPDRLVVWAGPVPHPFALPVEWEGALHFPGFLKCSFGKLRWHSNIDADTRKAQGWHL